MTFEIGTYNKLFFPFPTILIQHTPIGERQITLTWLNFYIGFAD